MDTEKKNEIIKLVLNESRKLQTIINDDLLKRFGELHNINPEYNFLNAKQELVADRGYFPGVKKKYALNIVNKEGQSTDELELKGLILRRSDYPSLTKIRVGEILDELLKKETVSFKKIRTIIEETREEMISMIEMRSKEIARPSSWTKPLDEYINMPMHIKGMLMWNKLEYDYFGPGTKGYLFRIKGIDPYTAPSRILEQLTDMVVANNIVVPYEEPICPSYYELDIPAIVSFAWDDRASEIVEPIKSQVFKEIKMEDSVLEW